MPDTARKTRRKCISHDISLQDTHSTVWGRGVERTSSRRAAILLARDQVPNCMMEGGKRG